MTHPVVTATPDTSLSAAVDCMLTHEIHRLVIVDEQGRGPLGCLSTTDVVVEMAHSSLYGRRLPPAKSRERGAAAGAACLSPNKGCRSVWWRERVGDVTGESVDPAARSCGTGAVLRRSRHRGPPATDWPDLPSDVRRCLHFPHPDRPGALLLRPRRASRGGVARPATAHQQGPMIPALAS
jgi:hypothetical protein